MKKVRLTKLSLLNFKGIRSLDIGFADDVSSVYGRNASGKTTIFDAFTWLLFGKDSQGRDKFDIKTLDGNGQPIPKLPHSVSAVLDVDGKTICLRREYMEKWVKRRGTIEEEFRGHEEKRFYNDVQCSVTEWRSKIETICPEARFREITNPSFFVGLKSENQRALLFEMAGGISDAEIAHGNKDFEELMAVVDGTSLSEYNATLAAKKRRVKEAMKDIPARIDENKRRTSLLEGTDFIAIRNEADAIKKEIGTEVAKLTDRSKAAEEVVAKRIAAMQEMARLKKAKYEIEARIVSAANAEYCKAAAERERTKMAIAAKKADAKRAKADAVACEEAIKTRMNYRESLISEWREINAREITFDEDSFVCPVCKRPLDDSDVETKIAEMTAMFNGEKAKDLAENSAKGKENKRLMEALIAEKKDFEAKALDADAEASKLQGALDAMANVQSVTGSEPLFQQDVEWVSNEAQLKEVEAALNKLQGAVLPASDSEDAAFIAERKRSIEALKAKLSECNALLAKEQELSGLTSRIDDLEKQYVQLSSELASIERNEFVIKAFTRAKTDAIEKRINSMFSFVKFKMFDTQVNGAEVETCEAMVDGVPYSSLNAAMRINAGLDIINALCKHLQLCAPIVIDNSESINEIMQTYGQQIRLYVSEDEILTVR